MEIRARIIGPKNPPVSIVGDGGAAELAMGRAIARAIQPMLSCEASGNWQVKADPAM